VSGTASIDRDALGAIRRHALLEHRHGLNRFGDERFRRTATVVT